jgi:hypothetical protein
LRVCARSRRRGAEGTGQEDARIRPLLPAQHRHAWVHDLPDQAVDELLDRLALLVGQIGAAVWSSQRVNAVTSVEDALGAGELPDALLLVVGGGAAERIDVVNVGLADRCNGRLDVARDGDASSSCFRAAWKAVTWPRSWPAPPRRRDASGNAIARKV